ncbi:MAG: DUF4406 domain-containing protein [Prevotellaceae bacterium]|jgi:hypothetical protein|nr:DUF4406 domain-containing protein [Prevotellaceae bacterium]
MRVYISGKTTDNTPEKIAEKFENAERLLREQGYEPINPLRHRPSGELGDYFLSDIALLIGCDAIFMLDGWSASKNARIEQFISETKGKIVLFENAIKRDPFEEHQRRIELAIQEVTGLKPDEYLVVNSDRKFYLIRLIMTHHLAAAWMSNNEIGKRIKRSRGMVRYMLGEYSNEIQFNREFAWVASKVDEHLKAWQ